MIRDKQDQIVDRSMTIVILLLITFGAYINWPDIKRWGWSEIVELQGGDARVGRPALRRIKSCTIQEYMRNKSN